MNFNEHATLENEMLEKYKGYVAKIFDFLANRGLIIGGERVKKQYEFMDELLDKFIAWQKNKGLTKSEINIHEENISYFLRDLIKHRKCSIRNMNDENLLSFVLDRSIRRRIFYPMYYKEQLLKSLQLFFVFLKEVYNLDFSWAEKWRIRINKRYMRRLTEFEKVKFSNLVQSSKHKWLNEYYKFMHKHILLPLQNLADDFEWSDINVMGVIEYNLYLYFNRLLIDYIKKNKLMQEKNYEVKLAKILKFQYAWAKTPISEVDNKTPIELIDFERLVAKTL